MHHTTTIGVRSARLAFGAAFPALAANRNPATVAEGPGILEDEYRLMLAKAARGDRTLKLEAVATMPLWWEAMPGGMCES